jgi:glycosyltransferase involved in cell wall biosynthesis
MKASLIVPLRDEQATVDRLLQSVTSQERPPDEVVVVDAGSEDETAARVASFPTDVMVRILRREPLFPGQARNAGAESASHSWLAFTDGGVRLDAAWLRLLLSTAQEKGADIVFGSFEPICTGLFSRAAALAYVPGRAPQGIRGPSVASMALTRSAFIGAGGFPPFRAAEDLIFIERLLALRLQVAYAPGAVVHWELAPDAARTFRRFAVYSEHNLRAGRERYWHWGVLRHYVVMALIGAAVAAAGGGGWALAVYPTWQLARAARSAWQKRSAFDFATLDPRLIAGAAALLCLIDLATLVGAMRWVKLGCPRTP